MTQPFGTTLSLVLAIALAMMGCRAESDDEVVVYAALDQEFSAPILDDFEHSSGIDVQPVFDVESTKTVGLYNRLLQERSRVRCDVFWNNEILHTLRLQREGLLEAYVSPAAAGIPENYRAPDGSWTGFAARARVLIVNTERLGDRAPPDSIHALADPQWKGNAGIARPLFGTTATHAAVLFNHWGASEAREFFERVATNAIVLSGNKQVAVAVGRGELVFGITDTDDAIIEREAGRPVEIIFPDQGPDQIGTLFIPNTIAILRNSPHPKQARALVDYLLTDDVERRLEQGASAQFPVRPGLATSDRITDVNAIRWMDVDFEAAAESWDAAAEYLYELFERGAP